MHGQEVSGPVWPLKNSTDGFHSLALCELHLALAALTLRVLPRMALYETNERDIAYDYDSKCPKGCSSAVVCV